MSVVEIKTYSCRDCGTELNDENAFSNWRKNKHYICKSCDRDRHRKRTYGISKEEYEAKLVAQNFSCAICKTHMSELDKALDVDHNHDTGEVRDLLCRLCNRAFGFLKEDVDAIERLLRYAKKWSNV